MDGYFKVAEVFRFSESDDDSQGRVTFKKAQRKESSNDFGNVFVNACDELKQSAGITHQSRGYASNTRASFHRIALAK